MNQLSKNPGRRKFIGNAAALGIMGSIGIGHILSSCKSNQGKYIPRTLADRAPDGQPLKAGLIGCGGRGTGAAANFLNSGPNVTISVLGDVFQDRLDRCRRSLKERYDVEIPDRNCFVGFDAYKQVIDSDVDVIIHATPPHFRPVHFAAAVQAKKHIFLEKPCAVDPTGVRSIMASGKMAEAAGLSVVVGTQFRNSHDRLMTFGMVKNGAIGDLISGSANRLSGKLWHSNRQDGWSDMETMIRDWVNWTWLSGDAIVEQFIHRIDILNWFFEAHPIQAVGFGGRARRPTGDQYDFISVDYQFEDGRKYHGMHRQIDGCYNTINEVIYGTKGYTNCENKIWDYNNKLIWEYEYPIGDDGRPTHSLPGVRAQDQSHIDLVTAIRTNSPVNQVETMATSTLLAIMGRESAYTGRLVTWDEMLTSNLRLGPQHYEMGRVDIPAVPRIPGISSAL